MSWYTLVLVDEVGNVREESVLTRRRVSVNMVVHFIDKKKSHNMY